MLQEIKYHLKLAEERMKLQYDQHYKEMEFKEGDLVYIKLSPFKQHSVLAGTFHKLSPKYASLFSIARKVGEIANEVQLPPEAKIHNVIHVSMSMALLGRTKHSDSSLLARNKNQSILINYYYGSSI